MEVLTEQVNSISFGDQGHFGDSSGGFGDSGKRHGGDNDFGSGERRQRGGDSGCRRCHKEGHIAKDCPEGGGGDSSCRRCHKEGHMAKDCTEEVLGPDGKPRPPAFKPEDIDANDETLFNTISSGINFDRYDDIPVYSSKKEIPPVAKFSEIITSQTLLERIDRSGFKKPTPIQKYGIPLALANYDIMACAQTGSGKTLAFVLPILQMLFNDKNLQDNYGAELIEPLALCIAPTRELAKQIFTEATKFSGNTIVKTALIYGGPMTAHLRSTLSRGCHFLVATPGRLIDFIGRGYIGLGKVKYFVLDEADRMIDIGFMPDIRKIVSKAMPPKTERQTMMFSATFPENVQREASEFLKKAYAFLTIGLIGSANSDVEQEFLKVTRFDKRKKLQEILQASPIKDRTIIFVEAKKTCDFLAAFLSQSGFKATSMHGDRFQQQREEALRDLKSGKFPVLVATDVASRGLDINYVKHVINYDMPKETDCYIHRIGRTGRVGNLGKATSFFDPERDGEMVSFLVKTIQDAGKTPPDWLLAEASGDSMESSYGGVDSKPMFGGEDIRGNNFVDGGSNNLPIASHEDVWE